MSTHSDLHRVQVEIPITTLQRLLAGHQLAGEELRCLNPESKHSLQQVFLKNLKQSARR
ncbi:MAG: hypothetical protein K6L73_11550 [Cellvibrionaceae bacterium]